MERRVGTARGRLPRGPSVAPIPDRRSRPPPSARLRQIGADHPLCPPRCAEVAFLERWAQMPKYRWLAGIVELAGVRQIASPL